MMLKGQDASNIAFGNSFSEDGHTDAKFDYLLANPPFGVEWKKVEDAIRAEADQAWLRTAASGPGCRGSTTAASCSCST
jgi:type I restriction-modification system DNA methylase subunit